MARSHHRKKHKEHLRQYQHTNEGNLSKLKRGKAKGTFAAIGIILGAAIGYFATDGILLWVALVAVAGGLGGFMIGHYIDKEGT